MSKIARLEFAMREFSKSFRDFVCNWLDYVEYSNLVNGPCKIFQQNIAGQPGYNCGSYVLILCLNCGQKAFYGQKNNNIHPYSLTLKMRKSWKCDICKKSYKNVVSFYCKSCDYDVCPSCYVAY